MISSARSPFASDRAGCRISIRSHGGSSRSNAGASVPSEQVLGRGGHQTTFDKLRHGLLNREILREFTESGGSYRQFAGTRPAQPFLPAGLGLLVPISTDSIGPLDASGRMFPGPRSLNHAASSQPSPTIVYRSDAARPAASRRFGRCWLGTRHTPLERSGSGGERPASAGRTQQLIRQGEALASFCFCTARRASLRRST